MSAALRPNQDAIAKGDVGFLARFWHPVWSYQTK
jgi:hypothetical protein